ncbi:MULTISPECIES: extracellular solute-binding protein [unclassified Actinomyces]|uniref:extracellular solute-binding protein n=1 Tax=unclassified Actinomyces TaxID=2609248 RepID=UPI002017A84A|nr:MULTISPECIES: extracellular solute-binding protein [unclassified Actinomyces]MCL3776662.1 extracellular solute-binding protein [Actinomyces sp. AC-20-1]MCL3790184.1 extracellular solute-binding protein [Actinomyces sp. 187325]MCL3792472.1 extracellular solute-binding protein [Actinomyces sp. 186855]MCL3795013.1 extracellular solute-binding protein [Actinomyces sp. 217892]
MYPTVSRRHLFAGVGLGALGVPLMAACGSRSGSGGADANSLSFMVLGGNQELNTYLSDTVLPAFKKESGIDVEVQSSDWGSAFQKVTTAAASGQIADVLLLGAIWTAPLAAKGALLPLDSYMPTLESKDAMFPRMLADGVWDSTQYSIPICTDVRTNVYRSDLLEKAGVDPTVLPTTWAELREVATKVRDAGVCESPIWFGLDKSIGLQQAFAILMFSNGAAYWKEDGTANFDSPEAKEALQFLVDCFETGLSDYHLVMGNNALRPVVAGQSAICFGGTMADISDARNNAPDVVDKLVIGMPLTGPSGSGPVGGAWINKLAVAKVSKNPEGAFRFIRFLTEAAQMSEWDRITGTLPVREDLIEEEWLGKEGKEFMELAKYTRSQDPHPGMMSFGQDINELLQSAVRGSATVDETAKAINDKLNAFQG